jgi:hypothetical protein
MATVGVHNLGNVDAYVDCYTGNFTDWEWVVPVGELATVTLTGSLDYERAEVNCRVSPWRSDQPVTVALDRVTLTAMKAESLEHVNPRP